MVRCLIKSHHQEYRPSKWHDDAEGMCHSVASLEPDPRYDGCCSNIFRPGRVVRDLIVGSLVVLAIGVVVAVIFVVCFFFMPGSESESALLGEESAFHGEPFSDEGGYRGINEVVFHNDSRYDVNPKLERIQEAKPEEHTEHDHAEHDHAESEAEPEPEPESEPEPTAEPEPESEPEPEPEGDHSHDHSHAHDDTHTHEHAHSHDDAHTHDHAHEHPHEHEHAHDDAHTHEHAHDDAHTHEHAHDDTHTHDHPHTHDHEHPHEHGPVTHDHTHPEMDHDHTHPEMDHDHTHPEMDHDHTHPEMDHNHTHPADHEGHPRSQESEVTSVHSEKNESLPPLFSLFNPPPIEGTLEELDIPEDHSNHTHSDAQPEGVTETETEAVQGECRERRLEMCSDLPHNMTAFPNWAGDQSEEQMQQTSLPFLRDVIVRSRCSPRAKEYSCAILEPPCDVNGNILPPCRTFCKSVAATCQEFINSRFSLSSAFDCDLFPDSTDPNVCLDMTQDVTTEVTENTTPEAETETTEPTLETTTEQDDGETTTTPPCPELQCLDGSCITLAQVNDGVVDCPGGIDEENFGDFLN